MVAYATFLADWLTTIWRRRRGSNAAAAETTKYTHYRDTRSRKNCDRTLLAARLGLRHINVGEIMHSTNAICDGYDNDLDTHILDEDKLLDVMENIFQNCAVEGIGIVADYNTCKLTLIM
jgi:hypothetical protein